MLSILLSSMLALAATPESVSVLRERPLLALHLGGSGLDEAGRSKVLEALERSLFANTSLAPVSVEAVLGADAGAGECIKGTNFRCWVDLFRGRPGRPPAFLLVLNALAQEGSRVRFAFFLMDLERANAAVEDSFGEEGDPLESRIFERAVTSGVQAIEVSDTKGLNAAFEALWTSDLAVRLETGGYLYPNGRVRVATPFPGLTVEVDGQAVGVTDGAALLVEGVRAGERTLHLVDPAGLRLHEAETFRALQGAEVVLVPTILDDAPGTARTVTLWSGVGVAVAGAAILVFALVAPHPQVDVRTSVLGDEVPNRLARSSDYFSSDAAEASGPLVAPLGYSLLAAGGTTAAGAGLLGAPDEFPWLAVLLGVALGGAAYGLSEALD